MTAREMFKGQMPKGKVLECSKGGYDHNRNEFSYCICDDGTKYNVKVISRVCSREFSVEYSEKTNVKTIRGGILYVEWQARVIENRKRAEGRY